MKQYRYHLKGFTLLEVLVSVSLFAIMASMAYAGLNHIIRSSEQIKESNQRIADLQFALFSIENDALQLVNRKIRNDYGDSQPALMLKENRLQLSRLGWQNLLQMPRSSIQRVAYEFDENKFIRTYWLTLDQALEQQPVSTILLDEVSDLEFFVVDNKGQSYHTFPNTQNSFTKTGSKAVTLRYLTVIITTKQFGEISKLIELDWYE